MAIIAKLAPHVANMIAAGEVVERPSSVVKELLENAVDAGATSVTVEIQNGGMTLLRVTDNGCGMVPEDAKTAFLRHATSKLREAQDLESISTMGFRGEALAAISSVSRIDLMTATKDATLGTNLHLEGGEVTEETQVGCPVGTTIVVRDLFFNTPARMKFMKSDSAESSAVLSVLQRQALSHPQLAIHFIKDGTEQLSTPGDGQLKSAIYSVFGRQFALELLPVSSSWENITVEGFTTKPNASRGNRTMETFYVNNRPVKSPLLASALERAYQNQMMVGRFPGCVIHITMPEMSVDVNVHPAKTEVKFLREREVFDAVHYGVLGALSAKTEKPELKLPASKPVVAKPPKQEFYKAMDTKTFQEFAQTIQAPAKKVPVVASPILRPAVEKPVAPVAKPEPKPIPVPEPKPIPKPIPKPQPPVVEEEPPVQVALELPTQDVRLVGEVLNTYLIAEMDNLVYFIDKHAAHERILFEKLQAREEEIMSQVLLKPVPVLLEPQLVTALLEHQETLSKFGFLVEELGMGNLVLRQIPDQMDESQGISALEELAGHLLAGQSVEPKSLRSHIHHTIACKAAIKGGWVTSEVEQLALVKEVLSREDIRYCPHGRPIVISLSQKELEKQFKR